MGPYGWDMKSTRGLKCADDARAGSVSSVGKRDGGRAAMRARVRANMRSGPGTEYGKVGLLEAGEEVRVTGEAGTWLRIETAAGDQAFVHGSLLEQAGQSGTQGRKDAEDRRRAALEKSRKEWCEKHRWVLNPKTETVIWKACVVGGKPVLLHASEAQDAFKRGICDSLMDWRVKWFLDESGLFSRLRKNGLSGGFVGAFRRDRDDRLDLFEGNKSAYAAQRCGTVDPRLREGRQEALPAPA